MASLPTGHVHISSDIDHSGLLFVGKNSQPQWFFFSKMDKKYEGSSIPRYTEAQMNATVKKYENFKFTEGATFKDLMASTKMKSYLALEEANHEFWTWGRVVCVGDSIHKMTPNVRSSPAWPKAITH